MSTYQPMRHAMTRLFAGGSTPITTSRTRPETWRLLAKSRTISRTVLPTRVFVMAYAVILKPLVAAFKPDVPHAPPPLGSVVKKPVNQP